MSFNHAIIFCGVLLIRIYYRIVGTEHKCNGISPKLAQGAVKGKYGPGDYRGWTKSRSAFSGTRITKST